MTPELALQKGIRLRLTATVEVVALVPDTSILDRNERPNPSPSIIIGEGQSVDEGDSISRNLTRVYMDLHVWKTEVSTAGAKLIAGAIRDGLKIRPSLDTPFHCVDCLVQNVRFLRDPDGETSHAVVSVSALVEELA
ncbi:DUF3168 domain-containing protein [Agrobacterium rhizogenes]|nr:DUF3168 domain-containing protein [Rhizobium rhizogenes]NTH70517.1 DUF3168 domain-containing protein [Rhizobium rhizogenes]NTJ00285.1 DUF3168 domain-containing protein [Rhizobium rhizogenes]